jgi:putative transposase
MKQTLTLACKLATTPEQDAKIEALLQAFAKACNYANEQVKSKTTSKTTIQTMVYNDLREQFGLSANQAVRVCARVGANRKTAKLKGRPVKARLRQIMMPGSSRFGRRIGQSA